MPENMLRAHRELRKFPAVPRWSANGHDPHHGNLRNSDGHPQQLNADLRAASSVNSSLFGAGHVSAQDAGFNQHFAIVRG